MADERKIGAVEIDRLYDFLDGLKASGYTIDPRQYLVLSDLLMVLIARGNSLGELPLKTLIAPLICSTPTEQQDFYQRFDRWYPTLLPVKQASLSGDGIALPPPPKRRWSLPTINRNVTILATVIVAEIALIIIIGLISNSAATGAQVINSTVSLYSVIFAVFSFMVWLGWRASILYQENQYITRELANQEPVYTKVPVKAYIQDVMPVMQFKPIVSTLRKRTQIPSSEVDVDRTIENALNRDNWLEIVYRQRQVMPEYVVLIDRKSRLDQQARFVQEVLIKLEADGVWLHQYEFSGDPRICFPLDRKDTPLRLKDLQSRHPDSRLLIFSGTNELINPLTGLLQDWLESLSYWQERAILTSDKLQKVLLEELQSRDFAVLPMTFDGLASLVRAFETDSAPLLTNGGVGLPAQLTERPMRWTGRDTPPDGEVKALVDDLKNNYLGENGFYWLCATAVYPELRWELTLHLGSALKDVFGQSLLTPELLIRIARLPWFRLSYMPDWIRRALIDSYTPEQEDYAREVLSNLLSTAFKGEEFDLTFARSDGDSFRTRSRKFIKALIRNSSSESVLQDYIFVKFISGGKLRKLAVQLPKLLLQPKSFLPKSLLSIFVAKPYTDPVTLNKTTLSKGYGSLFNIRISQAETITYRKHSRELLVLSWKTLTIILFSILGILDPLLTPSSLPAWMYPWLYFICSGALLITLPLFVSQFLEWSNDLYQINPNRIVHLSDKPLRSEKWETILLKDINKIEYERIGLVGILLNIGNILITIADKQFVIEDIPNPSLVEQDINRYLQKYVFGNEQNELITDEFLAQKQQEKRPLKVLLCHAHTDRDAVRGLYTRLTKDGVDTWLDKEKLLPGQDWELEIRKAVREADVVVVCLSKQFNQAGFRQKEVRLVLDTAMEKPEGEIFIIPARLEECDNLESLRKWHWVDLFEDDGYEMLKRALRAHADRIGVRLNTKRKISLQKEIQEKINKPSSRVAQIHKETADIKLVPFLCYAKEDGIIARELNALLKSENWIDPWFDEEDILPGQAWQNAVEIAVSGAHTIIVLLSKKTSVRHGFFQKELNLALDVADSKPEGTIFVIPIRLDECEVPDRLMKYQFVDYFGSEDHKSRVYSSLIASLKFRAEKLGIHTEKMAYEATKKASNRRENRSRLHGLYPEETDIAIWGPTQSGKDWLLRGFAGELNYYDEIIEDFYFELLEFDSLYSENPKRVYPSPPTNIAPTTSQEDYIFTFARKVKSQVSDDAHRLSAFSHNINVHNNRGSNLLASLLEREKFESSYITLMRSRYLIILLDPLLDRQSNVSMPQKLDSISEVFDKDESFESADEYSEITMRSGLTKDQYYKLLEILLQSLSEENTPKRSIAFCITKMDQIRLGGSNNWVILERLFGKNIYNLLKNYHAIFNIEVFTTSAAGYVNIRGKPTPNYNAGRILDENRWSPVNCAAPFFWIFERQEIEKIQETSNFLFRNTNLRRYIRYPSPRSR